RVHGGPQQRVQRHQTQGARLPLHHPLHHHALLRGRQAPAATILIPPKTAKNHFTSHMLLPIIPLWRVCDVDSLDGTKASDEHLLSWPPEKSLFVLRDIPNFKSDFPPLDKQNCCAEHSFMS